MIHQVLSWRGPVGRGQTKPDYCSVAGVVKFPSTEFPRLVVNELVCAYLGTALGLPVPAGAAVSAGARGLGFLSLQFEAAGGEPPPVIPADFVAAEPELAARIVVFDVWVGNDDREDDAIAYCKDEIAPAIFDHSHAIFCRESSAAGLSNRANLPLFDGCLVEFVEVGPAVTDAIEFIEQLPNGIVSRIAHRAATDAGLDPTTGAAVERFLLHRRTNLRTTIRIGQGKMKPSKQGYLL